MHPDLAIDEQWRRQDEEFERKQELLRPLQSRSATICSDANLSGQTLPQPLPSKTDERWAGVKQRHADRKQTDNKFH